MRIKTLSFVFCLFLFACSEKKTSISDFTWIEGKWNGSSGEMNFFEDWKPLHGNVLGGKGGALSGKDTVFSEGITITERDGEIFYTANVQENGGAVDFKFTGYKNDSIVFENPQHDFPQRVVYFRGPGDKLYACIDGLNQGKYERMEFFYQKAH